MCRSRRKRIVVVQTVFYLLIFVEIPEVLSKSLSTLDTNNDEKLMNSTNFPTAANTSHRRKHITDSEAIFDSVLISPDMKQQDRVSMQQGQHPHMPQNSTNRSENKKVVTVSKTKLPAMDLFQNKTTKEPQNSPDAIKFTNIPKNHTSNVPSEINHYQTNFNVIESLYASVEPSLETRTIKHESAQEEGINNFETIPFSSNYNEESYPTYKSVAKNLTLHSNSSSNQSTTANVQNEVNNTLNLTNYENLYAFLMNSSDFEDDVRNSGISENYTSHHISPMSNIQQDTDSRLKDPLHILSDSDADDNKFNKRNWDGESLFRNRQSKSAFSELESLVKKGQKEDGEVLDTLNPIHVLHQWENLEESFRESVDAVVRQALPLLIRASSEINLTDECYTSFFQLLLGLRRLRPWAFRMIDAFGKPPAGMLQGTVTSFGAYDECVNIVATSDLKVKNTGLQEQYFRGKYCTVEIKPPLPPKPQYYTMYQPVSILANFSSGDDNVVRQAARQAHAFYFLTYRMDVCVPSTCTQEDVNNMAQLASKYIDIEVVVPRCSVKERLSLDDSQIAMICAVGVLFALVALATLLDILREIFRAAKILHRRLNCAVIRFLLYFSLNSNAKLLFKTEASKNGLDSMRGMRFFGMAWLVLGHTYYSSNAQMYGNLTEASAFAEGFLFQVIVNSTVSIDTFFFISGVLLAYLTLQYANKEGVYSIPRLLVRRYVRIVPSYMMVIGSTFVLPHFGSGPFWNETVDPVVENCRRNWWTNLLFINNFLTTPEERCLEHSWYLSCDFQLFIVALFVLLAIIKSPVFGLILNFSLIMVSMILTGSLTYFYNVPPTLLASFPDPQERKFLNHVIISKPFCHLGPYCVGLATGYVFYNCRRIKLKAYHHLLGWGSSFAVTAAVVYGVLEWNKGNLPSTPVAVAYAATHRTAWALGLSWIAVICVSGYGGIINRMLSWKVFIPLSRLTHIVYLVHPLIQYILTGYVRERLQTNHIIMAYFFFGHIMTSYALAAACFCLFDGPVTALMRMICGDFTAPAPRLSIQSFPDVKKQDIKDVKERK